MAALAVLLFALLLPVQANQFAQEVLGDAVTLKTVGGINNASDVAATISQKVSTLISKKSDVLPTVTDTSPLSAINIIDATNEQRVKAGLAPLKTNEKLAASAKVKVQDMIKNQYFEHTSPSGKTVADLGNDVGYNFVVMGENLALGDFNNADDLLQAWMNSPGHRANILNTSYEDIGVYAAQGTYQGRTVWFAVQHFGTERGVCPGIDTALKNQINALNTSLKEQQVQIDTLRTQIEAPNHAQGQAYSSQITQFNAMVAKYNMDLTTSQHDIDIYNTEVVAFNKCLSQYQASPVVKE